MRLLGIVWNTTYYYHVDIENIINEYGKIVNFIELDLSSNEKLESFINELYDYSIDEKWKSNYKINDLIKYNDRKIIVYEIEIEDEEKTINKKGIEVNKKAQLMKDFIRSQYQITFVDNHNEEIYSENAFHLADSIDEYNKQLKVVNKYYKLNLISNILDLKDFDKEAYIEELNKIFDDHEKGEKINLKLSMQIHSNKKNSKI